MKLPAELNKALEDMRTQSDLYNPTPFWDQASQNIASELAELGLEKFRSLPIALDYFVPTYGMPGNGFSKEGHEAFNRELAASGLNGLKPALALQHFLSGRSAAMADYRVLLSADDQKQKPFLHLFSESNVGSPKEQYEFEGKRFSRSALNYLLGLAMLKKHLGGFLPKNILEVGGGYGTLGEILSSAQIENLRYIDVDIPPTSYVAQYYLQEVLGGLNVSTYAQTSELSEISIDSLKMASVLCAWQIEKLRGAIDLFVNFISFQEMEPVIVKNYLTHVDRLESKWVLLRNIREGKEKRTLERSGVDEPILGDDYLKMLPNYQLIERNVIPFGYETVDGFHSELLLLKRIP